MLPTGSTLRSRTGGKLRVREVNINHFRLIRINYDAVFQLIMLNMPTSLSYDLRIAICRCSLNKVQSCFLVFCYIKKRQNGNTRVNVVIATPNLHLPLSHQ